MLSHKGPFQILPGLKNNIKLWTILHPNAFFYPETHFSAVDTNSLSRRFASCWPTVFVLRHSRVCPRRCWIRQSHPRWRAMYPRCYQHKETARQIEIEASMLSCSWCCSYQSSGSPNRRTGQHRRRSLPASAKDGAWRNVANDWTRSLHRPRDMRWYGTTIPCLLHRSRRDASPSRLPLLPSFILPHLYVMSSLISFDHPSPSEPLVEMRSYRLRSFSS